MQTEVIRCDRPSGFSTRREDSGTEAPSLGPPKSAVWARQFIGSLRTLGSSNETVHPRRSSSHPTSLAPQLFQRAAQHDTLPESSWLHRTKSIVALQHGKPSLLPAACHSHHGPWDMARCSGAWRLQNGVGKSYRTEAPDLIYEHVTAPSDCFLL